MNRLHVRMEGHAIGYMEIRSSTSATAQQTSVMPITARTAEVSKAAMLATGNKLVVFLNSKVFSRIGKSCEDIARTVPTVTDGVHWMEPRVQDGQAFKVSCSWK